MGEASEHSLLSASAAPRWTRCYGSVALESTQPNRGSKYAAEGTAAHGLSAYLLSGTPNKEITEALINQVTLGGGPGEASDWIGETITADGEDFEVDFEFANHVQHYVDYCRSLGGMALVETRVCYANWLGVADDLAWGTSDYNAIYLEPETISIDERGYRLEDGTYGTAELIVLTGRLIATIVDLKFGQGVAVYPEDNEQAKMYAGGALNEIEMIMEVLDTDIIEIVIHQPRIGEGEPHSWFVQVGALKRWLKVEAAMAAQHAVKLHEQTHGMFADPDRYIGADLATVAQDVVVNELTPGDKQCRFCNAKAVCPALTGMVINTVAHGFVDLDALPEGKTVAKTLSAVDQRALAPLELAEKMKLIPLIEAAIKAWQEETKTLLLANEPVGDLWLKKGKKGDRKWVDPAAMIKKLKTVLGAKDALKPVEAISPTKVEEFHKAGKITDRQWKALQALYTQSEGGYTIALPGEKGEKYVPKEAVLAAFTPIPEDEDYSATLA